MPEDGTGRLSCTSTESTYSASVTISGDDGETNIAGSSLVSYDAVARDVTSV